MSGTYFEVSEDDVAKPKYPYSCGLGPALEVIGGKWKTLILWEIDAQPRRFGELRRIIPGISEKMLMQQLREMEEDGIVRREIFAEIPPRVEYSITPIGAALNAAVTPLAIWGKEHAARNGRLAPEALEEPTAVALGSSS